MVTSQEAKFEAAKLVEEFGKHPVNCRRVRELAGREGVLEHLNATVSEPLASRIRNFLADCGEQ